MRNKAISIALLAGILSVLMANVASAVTLTLYVHEGSDSGPIIAGAVVMGWDAAYSSFNQTTNSSGYVTIAGTPGTWQFSVSKSGYETVSWSQSITHTQTRHAFLQVQRPDPPTLISPSNGATVSLTPTFRWSSVSNANYYAIAIRKDPPNGPIVYNPQQVYGTSHTVPIGVLENGHEYRWNMQAHNSAGWSAVSGTLYFQTLQAPLPDLVVNNIWTDPDPPLAADYTTIAIQIKNQGNSNATGTFFLELYFDGAYKGHVYINGLVAGSTTTSYWQAMTWPGDTDLHTIRGMVDPDNTILESNENNNERSEQFSAEKPTPTISRSPTSLSALCQEGQNASPDSFELWNSGSGTLNYMISDNVGWLSCSPTNGNSTGEHDTINVNYSTSGLSAGSYSAKITISDPAATNDPQTILISLTVESSTIELPTVTTLPATDEGETTATLWGSIEDDGGEACQYRFKYETSGLGYSSGQYTSWTGSKTTGQLFSRSVSVWPGSIYYFYAKAKNSAGESDWGGEESFTTTVTKVTLTASVVGGHGVISSAGGTYDAGTEVTLTATPDAGYRVYGWSGYGASPVYYGPDFNTITVTMISDKTITVSFAEAFPILTTNVNPEGSGNVSPSSGTYDAGTDVTLTAYPNSGWEFDYWGGDASGTNTSVTITMNSNKHVTAYFTGPPPTNVTLTLYVHEDSASGPIIAGARVTGQDGAGVSFNKTTNASGYITITGAPGTWQFSVSKSGYQTNSWFQSTISSITRDAYLNLKSEESSGSPPSDDYFLGNQDNLSGSTADPINTATGNCTHKETDLQIRSRGKALSFIRYYNSQAGSSLIGNSLGIGWSHSYNIVLRIHAYGQLEGLVSIKWADGRTDYWYRRSGEGICTPYTPGLYDTLYYDPSGNWTLRTKEYDVYSFSRHTSYGKLESIADKNGNVIYLEYDHPDNQWLVTSVSDSLGRSVVFNYNEDQLLSSIQDFASTPRVVQYLYTGGKLSHVTDVMGGTIEYTYGPNGYLQSITDQRGVTTITNIYDSQGRVIEQLDGKGRLTTLAYDSPEKNQTTITDPMGNKTIHTHYTEYKLLRSIENPLGEVISYSYNANLNRTAIVDRNNHTTTFEYDTFGNVIRKIDPNDPNDSYDGGITAVKYNNPDFPHMPTRKTDALGNETLYEYDEKGNLIRQIDPNGNEKTWTYNSFGGKLTETDENASTTNYIYDTNGLLTEIIDVNHTWYGYDVLWRLISITDGRGSFAGDPDHITTTAYDDADRVISVSGPITSKSYQYDEVGNRTHVTNGRGYTTVYEYDNNNNLIRIELPAPGGQTQIIEYTYDKLDRKTSKIDGEGNVTTYDYDAAGRLIKKTNPEGDETSYTYDAQGNLLSITDGNDVTTFYKYDSLNRKIHQYDELGNHWHWQYDRLGNLTKHTDATGHITRYDYDELRRLISVTDDANNITEYEYDAVGNLIAIIDAGGKLINSKYYDSANRLIRKEDGLGNAYEYMYDGAGNIISETTPNGYTKTFVYDNENRLIEIYYPDSSQVTYSYDDNGNLISIIDPTGTTTYVYDELDRLISSTDSFGKTVQYSYDIVGNRASVTYPADSTNPARTVTYSYDKANRLDKIIDWAGRTWDYDTDGAGRITSLIYPNGVKKEQLYDSAGRLSALSYLQSDESEFISLEYTRDGQGNPINISEHGTLLTSNLNSLNIEYTYDENNRLISSMEPAETYGYDNSSNRINLSTDNISTTYTYDNDNRLILSTEPAAYSYDKNGSMTSRVLNGVTTTFSYDYENRLVSQITDSNMVEHIYDGLGNRIARVENGVSTCYILDRGRGMSHILCETDDSGNITAYYIHGPQILARIVTDGSVRYYHTNHIGSVVALTDETETVTDRYAYTPFGVPAGNEGTTPNPFTYVGGLGVMKEADGLYFMRARFYEPSTGRFLQADPVGNFSSYIYTVNNPLFFIDPLGLCAKKTKNILENIGKISWWTSEKISPEMIYFAAKNRPFGTSLRPYIGARKILRVGGDIVIAINVVTAGAAELSQRDVTIQGIGEGIKFLPENIEFATENPDIFLESLQHGVTSTTAVTINVLASPLIAVDELFFGGSHIEMTGEKLERLLEKMIFYGI